MKVVDQILPGVLLLEPFQYADSRGSFVKTFHKAQFAQLGIDFNPVEEFYSRSHAGVVRGMHFQIPPHDHAKLVYCTSGRVVDVLLDLRKASGCYGDSVSVELSVTNRLQLFIPSGIAHGFLSLEDDTIMIYKTSTVHAPAHDAGIRWSSFGYRWPVDAPIVSARDSALTELNDFKSPF